MRYRLRTLLILLAVPPPALAVMWWAARWVSLNWHGIEDVVLLTIVLLAFAAFPVAIWGLGYGAIAGIPWLVKRSQRR